MNVVNILLFCQALIAKINVDAKFPEKVTLTVQSHENTSILVNLIKVESFVANENIPMWIGRGTLVERIDSEKVMNELGPFTMYQDTDTSSATVYFHKRREFDGVIDQRYYIQNLSFRDRRKVLQVDESGPVVSRPITGNYFGKKSKKISRLPINELRGKNDKTSKKLFQTNNLHPFVPNIVYIETMLLINYDMVEELQVNSIEDYSPVVSYLLTLFNGVDMLYSKLDIPKMRFNIAGIIFGSDRESFPEMIKCYRQTNSNNWKPHLSGILDYMDAYCTVNATSDYLMTIWELIPRDSYDIAIFLTRYGLFVDEYNARRKRIQFVKLGGSARRYPASGYHQYKVNDNMYVPSTSITDLGNFSSYSVIVHETAHLFGVQHDELLSNNIDYSKNIMKATVGYCKSCLTWSEASRNYMRSFFGSPDGCDFINKPRSLWKPGPRKMWTVNQQCQCYGYKPLRKSSRKMRGNMKMGTTASCLTNLQCRGQDGAMVKAPMPMDGTPCDANKVCWNKDCREVENDEPNIAQ